MNLPIENFLEEATAISPVQEILDELRAGRMVVLMDEEDRENEGDLVMAAEFVTPEAINFMATYGRGLICLTLTEPCCRQLGLPMMVDHNRASMGTNFTVSIEAAEGVTTGISAADRAKTIQAAVRLGARPSDIVSPGHVFPLMAKNGGVMVRAGHTEAGCDLASMAGLTPASVICEILNEDGTMARFPDLVAFARRHDLKIGTIAALIEHRSQTEALIKREAERELKTPYGKFRLVVYTDKISDETHLALVKGQPTPERETLVRVHEPLSIIDLLDCEPQQHTWSVPDAMVAMQHVDAGVIVFLRSNEGGMRLVDQVRHPEAMDLARKELRDYGIGAQILLDVGVRRMKLMAVPRKMPSMAGFGLEVSDYMV